MDRIENLSRLYLLKKHWEAMLGHVLQCLPEEACGLVAGLGAASQAVYPVTNELHSPVRFRMEPIEQLNAFLDMEKHGWDLLAIYHSHPEGPSAPSETDLAEFTYPGVLYLIWYPEGAAWTCAGYRIANHACRQIELKQVDAV